MNQPIDLRSKQSAGVQAVVDGVPQTWPCKCGATHPLLETTDGTLPLVCPLSRRRGRPPGTGLPAADRREPWSTIAVTPAEREAIKAAADALDVPVAVYIRRAAVFAAHHLSPDTLKTRGEP